MIYYSGHSFQIDKLSYLLSTDVDLKKKFKLKYHAFKVDELLSSLNTSRNKLNILFLDACRDSIQLGTRGASKGLARPNIIPKSSLIMFATGAGETADDNYNFIDAIIKNITTPNLDILNKVKALYTNMNRFSVLTEEGKVLYWSGSSYNHYFRKEIQSYII